MNYVTAQFGRPVLQPKVERILNPTGMSPAEYAQNEMARFERVTGHSSDKSRHRRATVLVHRADWLEALPETYFTTVMASEIWGTTTDGAKQRLDRLRMDGTVGPAPRSVGKGTGTVKWWRKI